MHRLREAILSDVSEDFAMIGEMGSEHEELINAWNAVCEASPTVGIPEPITDADLESMFEDDE